MAPACSEALGCVAFALPGYSLTKAFTAVGEYALMPFQFKARQSESEFETFRLRKMERQGPREDE